MLKVGKVACGRYWIEWIDCVVVVTQDFISCRTEHDICLAKCKPRATGPHKVSSKVHPGKVLGVSVEEYHAA